MMNFIQADPRVNVVQAPKVTAFEGENVRHDMTECVKYVSKLDPVRRPNAVAFRPEVKDLTLGCILELSADLRPGEAILDLDLLFTSLAAMHTLTRVEEGSWGRIASQYQVPATVERRCRLAAPIPEGSSLMVSLGLDERPGNLGGIAKAAVGLLEAIGSPPLHPGGYTVERLVLITPREISPEGEG